MRERESHIEREVKVQPDQLRAVTVDEAAAAACGGGDGGRCVMPLSPMPA